MPTHAHRLADELHELAPSIPEAERIAVIQAISALFYERHARPLGDHVDVTDTDKTTGDVVLMHKNVWHGFRNTSDTEAAELIWAWAGAASRAAAGHEAREPSET